MKFWSGLWIFLEWCTAAFFAEVALFAFGPSSVTGYSSDGPVVPISKLLYWFLGILFTLYLGHIVGNMIGLGDNH